MVSARAIRGENRRRSCVRCRPIHDHPQTV